MVCGFAWRFLDIPEGALPLFITLEVPGPASVLCGVMAGMAFVAYDPPPSTSRIVLIRVPDTPRRDGQRPGGGGLDVDAQSVVLVWAEFAHGVSLIRAELILL